MKKITALIVAIFVLGFLSVFILPTKSDERPNVIFILTDDQRYDAMGFLNHELKTPNIDRMAEEGTYFPNAFVTTALCSPSRATILTSQYMHDHGIVDNNAGFKKDVVFFPEKLKEAGYKTAFIGKWHMGGLDDSPKPGFDYWLSFPGQGRYYPTRNEKGEVNSFNINGKRIRQKGYITDELTQYAIKWMDKIRGKKPFFLYLSHKAVHARFSPAPRHRTQYSNLDIELPASMEDSAANREGKPLWVQNQRNSHHGVEFAYETSLDIAEYKRQYYRALSAVDDSVGELISWLSARGMMENTIIIFMGDNGFLFGEHGLIDKRHAYEESIRVPLLVYGKGIAKGHTARSLIANLDIGPTIIDIAKAQTIPQFEGQSFLPMAAGKPQPSDWRSEFFYEYFWEFNYPQTPTTFAIRSDRYKLIQYHGIWDRDELYDLQNDPKETNNLIESRKHLPIIVELRQKLYKLATNAKGEHVVPYTYKFNQGAVHRYIDGSKSAEFPEDWERVGDEADIKDYKIPDENKLSGEGALNH